MAKKLPDLPTPSWYLDYVKLRDEKPSPKLPGSDPFLLSDVQIPSGGAAAPTKPMPETPIPGNSTLIVWYWDIPSQSWQLRNTADGIELARGQQHGNASKFIKKKGFLLVEKRPAYTNKKKKQGSWYILWSAVEGYTMFHAYDKIWAGELWEEYDDVIFDIDCFEGRAKPIDLDARITEEEKENSEQRWSEYENANIALVKESMESMKDQVTQIRDQLATQLEEDKQKAEEYMSQMKSVIEQEIQDEQDSFEAKKLLVKSKLGLALDKEFRKFIRVHSLKSIYSAFSKRV